MSETLTSMLNKLNNRRRISILCAGIFSAVLGLFFVRPKRTPVSFIVVPESIEEEEPVSNLSHAMEITHDVIEQTVDILVEEVLPKMRGLLHMFAAPVVLIAGLAILIFAPDLNSRIAISIFLFSSVQLFTMSALYHRTKGKVSKEKTAIFHKLDHLSISFLIGGTTTAFGILLLNHHDLRILLIATWSTIFVAVLARFIPKRIPRYINMFIYIALGWAPIFFVPAIYTGTQRISNVGLTVFILFLAGGILYTIGAILFGVRPKKLEFFPGVFGYHENFHLLTILAFFCHYVSITLIAFNV